VIAALAGLASLPVADVCAQLAPVEHDGYLEYRFRAIRTGSGKDNDLHSATWRTQASTYVWRPYILLLDGNLGLTRTRNVNSRSTDTGTILTGELSANAFASSTFPLRVYFQSRDSRVDGDVFDTDYTTRNWGFLQQLVPRRTGARLALEYRRSDTDEVTVNGTTELRKYGTEFWQLTGDRTFGRNEFRLVASKQELEQDVPRQARDRDVVNLRHRYSSGGKFSVDDTLFYSDEGLNLHGEEQHRRFLQFNGYANWRPATSKPLLVVGRLVAQGVESVNGTTRGSENFVLSSTATYQYSPQTTFSASAGVDGGDSDGAERQTGTFQRLRGTYRSLRIPVGSLTYNWGGSLDVGNRRLGHEGAEPIQTAAVSFNQGLNRIANLASGRQLQISFTQAATALANTDERREQSLVHTAYVTLNRQRGRMSSYLRFSASDRRFFGDRGGDFQLFSLIGSSRMQFTRTRSVNGGFSVQYSDNTMPMMMNGEMNDAFMMNNGSLTYSVNLNYADRELFGVRNLGFLSELRYLSAEFRNDDPFEEENPFDPNRSDSSWRNELNYRIGLLEMRLVLEARDINGRWTGQGFFTVRRYYGTA
jgi:hypothetical protein